MPNKRLKIENLENLQEVTTEEFSSIQGGLSIMIDPGHPIDWNPEPIHPPQPIHPPEPIKPPIPIPCHPKPIHYPIPCYTGLIKEHISFDPKHISNINKHDKIHIGWWCKVVL